MSEGRIRRELRKIRLAEPGTRFETTHERHRIGNRFARWFVIGFGILLLVGASVTFWVPGPNFVLVLVGLALVSGQWRMFAQLLDRIEVALRRWNNEIWDPMPRWKQRTVIAAGWLVGAAAATALGYLAWRSDLLPGWIPFID
jgi:hypothetical protein